MMFLYYLQTLPNNAKVMLQAHLLPSYARGMIAVYVATTLYLLFAWLKPRRIGLAVSVAMFTIISVLGVWPEERMRESMRKPYVAGQYIYSNQVIARNVPGKDIQSEVERIANEGFLKLHPFVPERLRTVTEANRLEAGRLLTKIACTNCHALEPGAPLRNIPDKLHRSADPDLIAAFLRGPLKHGSVPYMPRIDLPEQEIKAIASYLAAVNRGLAPSAKLDNPFSAATRTATYKE
jgi:mono/diheme cytochrome c family protein